MSNREEADIPAFRDRWAWLGSGAIALALLVAVVVAVPRLVDRDPCDIALPAASALGLELSDDDDVVSCEWHSSFPDSSGAVMVRTASITSREALLVRSGWAAVSRCWLLTCAACTAKSRTTTPRTTSHRDQDA